MPEEGFTVKDRRLFDEDGRLKEGAKAEEPAPKQEAPRIEAAEEKPKPAEKPRGPLPPATFGSLLMGLATSAFVCLGEGPEGQRLEPDLPAAKRAIDLLAVLEAKTKGNLDEEESGLLTALLYDLRMKYVQKSK